MLRRFVVAVLFTLLLCTPVFAMKNEPDGFGGIKWGDKLSQHRDLKRKEDGSYYRSNEQREATSIIYSLDEKEGLYFVYISVLGWDNIQGIINASLEQWGKPDSVTTGKTDEGTTLAWHGKRADVLFNHGSDLAVLLIIDNYGVERVKSRKINK